MDRPAACTRCARRASRSGCRPGFWDNDGRCCGTAGVGQRRPRPRPRPRAAHWRTPGRARVRRGRPRVLAVRRAPQPRARCSRPASAGCRARRASRGSCSRCRASVQSRSSRWTAFSICAAGVGGRRAAGDPADQRGEPDVADDPGDGDVVVGELGLAGVHGPGEHPGQQHADVVDLGLDRGVGEHERAGERLGEVRVALEAAGGLAEHVDDPLGRRCRRGSACRRSRRRRARTRGRGRRPAGGSWRGSSGRACRGRRWPARRRRASGRRRSRPGWPGRSWRRGSACGGRAAQRTRDPRPSESSCCSHRNLPQGDRSAPVRPLVGSGH